MLLKPTLLSLLLACIAFAGYSQCGCDHTIDPGNSSITFDGNSRGVQPGDVICINAGYREKIVFRNINGSPTNPVIVKNCGGKAELGGTNVSNTISFARSRYFRITGTGSTGEEYGIKILGSRDGSQGLLCFDKSSDIEVDHMEITGVGFAGIMIKDDPRCSDRSYERPAFTMYNVSVHDNYIHDLDGEGVYLGNSFYRGTTVYCGFIQYPHEIRGVRIYDNLLENTGWEAIQVGAAVEDVEVYNNTVINYGIENRSSQNGGIQMGVGTTGRLYNNFIDGGAGPALVIQGIGENYVYNNIIIDPGTEAVNVNTRPTPLTTDIVSQGYLGGVYVINNTIVNANTAGIKENINTAPNNVLFNNLVVNSASNWDQRRIDTDWTVGNNEVISSLSAAQFQNAGAKDFRIRSTSPARNAGLNVNSYGVVIDHGGLPRPVESVYDAGAYEYRTNDPSCDAGPDRTITLPTNSTTLNGTASSPNGSITSYSWTKLSGGNATLQNENTVNLQLSALVEGNYQFQLSVVDEAGGSCSDNASVTVVAPPNVSPTADAGPNATITLPTNSITLNGSGSDPDGTIDSYLWSQTSGPDATLAGSNTPNLQLTELVEGEYTFQLTVTDNNGATGTANVTLTVNAPTVNQPPTVNAGSDVVLSLPTNTVNLNATASDADGSVDIYLWEKRSGPAADLVNQNTANATAQNLVEGIYIFRITVTDNQSATGFDEVQVSVVASNQPPVANAGNNRFITLPTNSIVLNGSGTDADGNITGYEWNKVSSLAADLANANTPNLTITGMEEGVHTFSLTVTDDDGATNTDEVQVTVNPSPVNQNPTANAGPDATITLPLNNIDINGSGTDPDGAIVSYAWSQASGPAATLTGTDAATLSVSNMVAGTYRFILTVTDNEGASDTDAVNVVVFPEEVNQSPIANAGGNKVITLPTNSIVLNSAGIDPDGTIESFSWTKVSGPAATLSPTGNTLEVTEMVEGVYEFQLEVTDNEGATSNDFVTVTVNASNIAPTVNAGDDINLVLPNNSLVLNATASDPDGTIATYSWVKSSGGTATLTGETTSSLSISNLTTGSYVFTLTVTDDDGAMTSDDILVTVLPNGSNLPPQVSAGADIVIFLPTNSVNITATANDTDGSIASYTWSKLSGPATLVNPGNQTVTITGLGLGINEFSVTATDDDGATDSDQITVILNPATSNQVPTANADGNRNIQLPTNSINLSGSGTDVDGSVTSYAWSKISGPSVTLSNANNPTLGLSNMVEGVYIFRLVVTDNDGAVAFDEAIINVLPETVNQAPTVDVGPNQNLVLPQNNTNLLGLAGDVDGSVVSYEWTRINGPASFTLTNGSLPVATLTDLVQGTYVFRLTVFDDDGATGFDDVRITVNAEGVNVPPRADAGGNQVLVLPNNSINLLGSASDQDGTVVSYNWTKVSGGTANLINTSNPTVTITDLTSGTYVFRLRVTDNDGATNDDAVTVIVNPETVNLPPIVNAGADKTLFLPNSTSNLLGVASDQDGQVISLAWEKISGPEAVPSNVNSNNLLLSGLEEGIYVFRLNAEDDDQASAYDEIRLTVLPENTNNPPTVDLGSDVSIFLPQSEFTINALTEDNDGTIVTSVWSKVSGPAVTLSNPNEEDLVITNFVEGVYVFQLNVIDDDGGSGVDQVQVSVFPPGVNQPPTVDAGDDVELVLPQNQVTLNGTAVDNNGTINTILWQKVLGPAATLTGENTLTLELTDLVEGRYTFSLTATDDEGAFTTDQVKVNVNPELPNIPPIVNAGVNVSSLLPIEGVTFEGSVEDEDGQVVSFEWSQFQGPAVTLSSLTDLTLEVTDITEEGLYGFRLSAIDDDGDTAADEVYLFAAEDSLNSILTNILTYNLQRQLVPSEIDFANATILIKMLRGTDLSSLVADFELTEGAFARVGSVVQESGSTPNDFSSPVIYTVISSEGTDIRDWTVFVQEIDGINVPKYFSPNNDGIADVWEIQNVELVQSCKLEVFSRSGQLVYEAQPYENNWDGTLNGSPLKEEDYYYIFSCDGERVNAGGVRIIR